MDLGARALPRPQRGPARRARGGARRSGASRDDDGFGDAPAGGNLSSFLEDETHTHTYIIYIYIYIIYIYIYIIYIYI